MGVAPAHRPTTSRPVRNRADTDRPEGPMGAGIPQRQVGGMTGDEYYALEDQLAGVRRQLFDLREEVGTLREAVRLLRYDLDVLERRQS